MAGRNLTVSSSWLVALAVICDRLVIGLWICGFNSVVKLLGGRVHSGWCRHIGFGGTVRGNQIRSSSCLAAGCIRVGVVTLVGGTVRGNQTWSSSCLAAGEHSGWCRHIGLWHCSRKSNLVVKLLGGRVHSGWCRHIGWWHCSRKSNSVVKLLGGRGASGMVLLSWLVWLRAVLMK